MQVLLDLSAILARLLQQYEHLIVILAGCSLPEAYTAHGIGSIDRGMDGQAGRSNAPLGVEFARCRLGILLGLARYRLAWLAVTARVRLLLAI